MSRDDNGQRHRESEDSAKQQAAIKLQRVWRRQKLHNLDVETRWEDATVHARLQAQRDAANQGKNDPRSRWKRAAFLASRLQDNDEALKESGEQNTMHNDVKILETQHWLELTDSKHRYGSNLKYYHRRWLEEDTEDNFFKWLDQGGGKHLSLSECSREQLEKERIIYLSLEQRMNYLVKIDEKGLLRWARNNDLIDTTAGKWQDSGNGSGIVLYDRTRGVPPIIRRTSFQAGPVRSHSSSAVSSGSEDSQNATHYVGAMKEKNPLKRWFKKHLTAKGWSDMVLRKTVRRNTWIYVADKHCSWIYFVLFFVNLFIGIKDTGAFQHSSFLAGGLVTSAGLISVHEGLIHTLSPLSGHYRTKIDNFKRFVEVLRDRGVDMHRAEISKAQVALWCIERIGKAKKAKGDFKKTQKERVELFAGQLSVSDFRERHEDDSQWRRDILVGRKKVRDLRSRAMDRENPEAKSEGLDQSGSDG